MTSTRSLYMVPVLLTLAICLARAISGGLDWYAAPESFYAELNNDALLRLDMVRSLWQEGGWQNHVQMRINSPFGLESPWTRVVDVLVLLLAIPFLIFLPIDGALQIAALLYNPLLSVLCVWLLTATLRQQDSGFPFSHLFVPLAFVCYPAVFIYFKPGDVDHHSLLATLSIAVLYVAARLAGGREQWAYGLGALFGLGIWVSVEFQFVVAATGGWLGLLWVITGKQSWRRHLARAGFTAALVTLLAQVTEHPLSRFLEIRYDTVSIVHTVLLAGTSLLGLALHLADRLSGPRDRLFAAGMGSVALLAGLIWLFPALYLGPMADVHPDMRREFLRHVEEMQPLFHQPDIAAACLFFLSGGLWLVLRFRAHAAFTPYTLLLGMANLLYLGLALSAVRTAYYLGPASILLLAYGLHLALLSGKSPAWLHRPVTAVLLALSPFYLLALLSHLPLSTQVNTLAEDNAAACQKKLMAWGESGELVAALGNMPQTVSLPSNWGTYILWRTPYSIISANYHRDHRGYLDQLALLRWKNAENGLHILHERHITVLILCDFTANAEENGLLDYIRREKPVWAVPVPELTPQDSPLRVYRVEF